MSSDRNTLTVAAINATADPQTLNVGLAGFIPRSRGRLWRLTGPGLDATNRVGQPAQVTVSETDFDTSAHSLSVTPYSVELRAYPRR